MREAGEFFTRFSCLRFTVLYCIVSYTNNGTPTTEDGIMTTNNARIKGSNGALATLKNAFMIQQTHIGHDGGVYTVCEGDDITFYNVKETED